MIENLTRIVCDGLNGHKCGKVIAGPADGIVINGTIGVLTTEKATALHTVIDTKGKEMALCWYHFQERCPGSAREVIREVTRTEYVERYEYEPGNRATGPLPPPDLPHCVEVVRALCTLR